MATKKAFKVQIPTDIVRNNEYTAGEFTLLAKLIQAYYIPKVKNLSLNIDHKALMFYLFIKDHDTFKKHLKGLFEKGAIKNEITTLPRKGPLVIELSDEIIPQLNKKGHFTQMQSNVLSRDVIEAVGYIGVRLLYYYESYINYKDIARRFCWIGEETTANDLGITEKTVIKYNKFLEKRKFIKIDKHKSENGYNHNDQYVYFRYSNHYFIRHDKITEFCEKSSSLLA
ncbi:hypothetical protein [Sutcliffiella horikoshii]|uniref:Uncharacterized protein n=1 Tax=Sutcliffiella horikoshii TaxID=79883 RepID=A0A5D4TK24_9BACI|nr:hypothetical protein [Sutcliffiella horikoshii]TYS74504.1 hypothetical protein FZC75_02060 [Sutcliffiella horikoshii]